MSHHREIHFLIVSFSQSKNVTFKRYYFPDVAPWIYKKESKVRNDLQNGKIKYIWIIKWYDKDIMDSTRFNTSRLFQIWFVLSLHYIILLHFIILKLSFISSIQTFPSELHSIRDLNFHGFWNRKVHGFPMFWMIPKKCMHLKTSIFWIPSKRYLDSHAFWNKNIYCFPRFLNDFQKNACI